MPYEVLSPDGIEINPGVIYKTKKETALAIIEWCKRYHQQGYYKTASGELIPADKLDFCCQVNELMEFLWIDKSGRGQSNMFTLEELTEAFRDEIEEEESDLQEWLENEPQIGDEWNDNANKIIRIK